MPSFEVAPIASKAAIPSGVTPASLPPTTQARSAPRSTSRIPSPIAWAPAAQAETVP